MKHTLLYAVSIGLSNGVSLLMLPWLASQLTVEDFGVLQLLALMVSIGSVICAFAMTEALYRFVSGPNSVNCVHFLWIRVNRLTLAGLGLCILALPFIEDAQIRLWIALAGLTTVLEGQISFPMAWLRMQDRSGQFARIALSKVALQTALTIIFVSAGYGVSGMLVAGLVAILMQALALRQAMLPVTQVCPSPVSGWVRHCAPLTGSGLLAIALFSMERAYIGHFDSLAEVGRYSVAAKFGLALAFLLQPYGMWFFPKRFELSHRQNETLNELAQGTAVGVYLLGFAAFSILLTVPNFVFWLLPEDYWGGMAYLLPVIIAMAAKELSEYANFGLWKASAGTLLKINVASTLMATASMIIAGVYFGGVGIAYALAMASCLRTFWIYHSAQKIYQLELRLPVGVAVLSIVLGHFLGQSLSIYLSFAVATVLTGALGWRWMSQQHKLSLA